MVNEIEVPIDSYLNTDAYLFISGCKYGSVLSLHCSRRLYTIDGERTVPFVVDHFVVY